MKQLTKTSTVSNDCKCCAFFGDCCMFSLKRPWNKKQCPHFRPYCVICEHPDWLCWTCCNQSRKDSRPALMRKRAAQLTPITRPF